MLEEKMTRPINREIRMVILPSGKKVQVLREFKTNYAVCNMGENRHTTKNWWLINKVTLEKIDR
jgi:hypothetical protein